MNNGEMWSYLPQQSTFQLDTSYTDVFFLIQSYCTSDVSHARWHLQWDHWGLAEIIVSTHLKIEHTLSERCVSPPLISSFSACFDEILTPEWIKQKPEKGDYKVASSGWQKCISLTLNKQKWKEILLY